MTEFIKRHPLLLRALAATSVVWGIPAFVTCALIDHRRDLVLFYRDAWKVLRTGKPA